MSKNDGGPAFPPVHDPDSHPSGMTLRDYAAIKFAAAWASALSERRGEQGYSDVAAVHEALRLGTLQADHFIAERAKERTP